MNCWVIIHCLEVRYKEDQITSAQREWFIFVQMTDKQWIITQQFTHWSWSISILTHNKWRKHIQSLQLLPTFRHCTEELPPILRLRRIRLHEIVTSFNTIQYNNTIIYCFISFHMRHSQNTFINMLNINTKNDISFSIMLNKRSIRKKKISIRLCRTGFICRMQKFCYFFNHGW